MSPTRHQHPPENLGNSPENKPNSEPIGPREASGSAAEVATPAAYHRRVCREIAVGSVRLGGRAPIAVQSMLNTPAHAYEAGLEQIEALAEAGADLVRISCPDAVSTSVFKRFVAASPVPLIADIHYHYRRALEAAEAGAACLRINPGNIGGANRVREIVAAAKQNGCAIRVGVNGGSLSRDLLEKYGRPTPEALCESALESIALLERLGFESLKLSVKASDVWLAVGAYRLLASACDYPLHLGITEAGGAHFGSIKSAIGLGALLMEGIGDTIRVSLSADPVEEIKVGLAILKALALRSRGVTLVACPSCARQRFDVITTVATLEARLAHIREPMLVSIMGCVVNGPGEARLADIGLTGGGGTPERSTGVHQLYLDGKALRRIQGGEETILEEIVALVEKRAQELAQRRKRAATP